MIVSGNVCVTPPPVAVTVTVETVGAVEPPQPVSCTRPTTPAISARARSILRRFFQPRKPRAMANVTPPGRNGLGPCRRAAVAPKLTVSVVVVVAGGVIDAGLKVQPTFGCPPLQAKVMGAVNVTDGATVMAIEAGVVFVTVADDGLAEMVKVGNTVVTV